MSKKDSSEKSSRSSIGSFLKTLLIILFVTVIFVAGWVKHNIYASKLTPVSLRPEEQKVLDSKLTRLAESAYNEQIAMAGKHPDYHTPAVPEPYTEKGSRREIQLTEKELNSLIASKPEVAQRVAIDLSDNLVSLKLIIPVDEEVPVLGGKTLRFHMGLIMSYEDNKPLIALKGVSLGGIPIPNAWLGYMKNKNLLDEFGTEGGFWQLFSEGVQDIKVKEGHLLIKLKQ